jgi:hypothetical protein
LTPTRVDADKPAVTLWLGLRLAKFVGVLAFAMGIAIAIAPREAQLPRRDAKLRQRAAHWLVTPGFILTWVTGWGMARVHAISLGTPYISISMVASLIALHETVRAVEPGRPPSRWRTGLILVALFAALAPMVIH